MQLYYEGVNISDYVDIVSAKHRDASGGRLDSLEIEMDNAPRWYEWNPKKDDRVELIDGNYTSGLMYIDMILPANGYITLTATSAKSGARRRAFKSFENRTIADIIQTCAAECGMDWIVLGVDENAVIPYIIRKNEKITGFLHRLAAQEGAVLKCISGRLAMIGIEYAQNIIEKQIIEITNNTPKTSHQKIDGIKLSGINVVTPYASGTAIDLEVENGDWLNVTDLPAYDDIQAARWSRGRLLINNRLAETLVVPSSLNPYMTAMVTVGVAGTKAIAGRWIVDVVEHDIYNKKSKTQLLRCVASIK